MSRCFPYPHPGYQMIGEPLAAVKSIKNEPKQEKGRKGKKEKREKGLKSQKHHRDLEEKVEPIHKKRKYDNGGDLCEKKISKLVMEPLENSDLSEEHGLPSSIPLPCESWESTQSSRSRKLKRGTAFAPTRSHGSIILRIKLPLQKHKSPVPDTYCKDPQPVSSIPECAPADEDPCFSGRSSEEAPLRAKDGKIAHGRESGSRKSKKRSKSGEMRRQIRDLISDWKPAQLQGSEPDQDWLFERKQYKDPCCGLERIVEDNISSEKGSVASYQPRACFMPEFNTYQMPYIFPF